jgi:hypothetical protein
MYVCDRGHVELAFECTLAVFEVEAPENVCVCVLLGSR